MSKFFIKSYKDSFKFLREARWYIVFALGVFSLFFIIGFLFPIFFNDIITKFLTELEDFFIDKNLFETIFLIFFNNLRAGFFAMILGIGFGIIPLVILIVNGYLVGFVSRGATESENIFVLLKLLPHGIFELPGFLFSVGIGLKIGLSFFDKKNSFKKEIKKSLIFFLFIVIPLLIIAAIIEGLLIVLTK